MELLVGDVDRAFDFALSREHDEHDEKRADLENSYGRFVREVLGVACCRDQIDALLGRLGVAGHRVDRLEIDLGAREIKVSATGGTVTTMVYR